LKKSKGRFVMAEEKEACCSDNKGGCCCGCKAVAVVLLLLVGGVLGYVLGRVGVCRKGPCPMADKTVSAPAVPAAPAK
jgi:hypothetical protein